MGGSAGGAGEPTTSPLAIMEISILGEAGRFGCLFLAEVGVMEGGIAGLVDIYLWGLQPSV